VERKGRISPHGMENPQTKMFGDLHWVYRSVCRLPPEAEKNAYLDEVISAVPGCALPLLGAPFAEDRVQFCGYSLDRWGHRWIGEEAKTGMKAVR